MKGMNEEETPMISYNSSGRPGFTCPGKGPSHGGTI
jgi:hypothetical protein